MNQTRLNPEQNQRKNLYLISLIFHFILLFSVFVYFLISLASFISTFNSDNKTLSVLYIVVIFIPTTVSFVLSVITIPWVIIVFKNVGTEKDKAHTFLGIVLIFATFIPGILVLIASSNFRKEKSIIIKNNELMIND